MDITVHNQFKWCIMENMRDFLSQDISSLLEAVIDRFDGDIYNKSYVGKVINNIDPLKEGRCQIKVFGIFDKIPNNDLPWAQPDFNFIGSTIGSFVVPPINTIVKVYFDNDDIYFPHYSTKVNDKNKLSSLRLENYPDTMVIFQTDEGDYLTMNRKTKKFIFHHNSGNNLEINKDGDTNILINGNENTLVKKDEVHTVIGDHTIKNNNIGLIKIEKDGNITISGGYVKIDHSVTLELTGTLVVPSNVGPMNSIPVDPLTGLPHAGNICV